MLVREVAFSGSQSAHSHYVPRVDEIDIVVLAGCDPEHC